MASYIRRLLVLAFVAARMIATNTCRATTGRTLSQYVISYVI